MDIPRIAVLVMVLPLGLAPPVSLSEAQPAAKVYRIGVLDTGSAAASSGRVEAFRRGLRELDLIEGQNLHIEWRFADGKELAVTPLAAELVALKPDVLVPLGGAGVGELRRETTEIPIVMAGAHGRGAGTTAEALAQSQENFTGIVSTTRALDEKRMDLLREGVPAVSRVTILQDHCCPN